MTRAGLGATSSYPPIDYQDIIYYSAPKPRRTARRASTRSIRSCCETYEKLGIPLHEQKLPRRASRSTRCSTASRSRPRSRRSWPKLGIIFCSFSEAVQEHPELVQQVPRHRSCRTRDNFFAALNSAVFTDGSFVYVPKGVRCPMELSTYFRINAREHRPVRAHADHRRRGRVRQLPRRLHRADARREPAARRGRRARRARRRRRSSTRRCRTGIPGDENGKGGIYNFVTKRGDCRGARLEDLLDAGRDRLGDHLEVSELHPAGRRLGRRVLLGRADQQLPAGRHRHEDDPHRQEHAQHDRLQGHLAPATARTPIAAW